MYNTSPATTQFVRISQTLACQPDSNRTAFLSSPTCTSSNRVIKLFVQPLAPVAYRAEWKPGEICFQSRIRRRMPLGGEDVMSSASDRRLAPCGKGAIALSVLYALCVPGFVQAGCNHVVASRADSARLAAISRLSLDLAAHPDKPPTPLRPCSGAFCTGQPATPTAPAGALDTPIDSWAWSLWDPRIASAESSFWPIKQAARRPVRTGRSIFHPPRSIQPV
jgi:hypothetical protein